MVAEALVAGEKRRGAGEMYFSTEIPEQEERRNAMMGRESRNEDPKKASKTTAERRSEKQEAGEQMESIEDKTMEQFQAKGRYGRQETRQQEHEMRTTTASWSEATAGTRGKTTAS